MEETSVKSKMHIKANLTHQHLWMRFTILLSLSLNTGPFCMIHRYFIVSFSFKNYIHECVAHLISVYSVCTCIY